MVKFGILGYNTINVGDDIQSFVTSTLLDVDYIVMRDDYDKVYNFKTGEECTRVNETVYLIMNGWFMHNSDWRTGNNDIKFPIKNRLIIPLYISTCLSKDVPLLYGTDCIEHYKKNGPILCRDTTTLKLLETYGVDAMYYGCLTQLLDTDRLLEKEDYSLLYSNSVIYIDCVDLYNKRNPSEKAYHFEHYINDLTKLNPKERIEYAKDLLTKYKYAKRIYTSRLHAFLPCRAMGLDVIYVGDMNYRVSDLVARHDDKCALRRTFDDYIETKTSTMLSETNASTIVTGYFQVSSKFPHEKYVKWMENMLKYVETPMVIFTDRKSVELIKELRKKHLAFTKIVVMELEDFHTYQYLPDFRRHHEFDLEKDKHSPELYMIWSEKSFFVRRAMEMNVFHSDYFFWCDIGSLRGQVDSPDHRKMTHWPYITDKNRPKNQVVLAQTGPIVKDDLDRDEDGVMRGDQRRRLHTVGGLFGGSRRALEEWATEYERLLRMYLKKDKFAGKDQLIYLNILVNKPDLINLIHDKVGNVYYAMYKLFMKLET